ncbi:MAG: multidrug effflux MFS transporter [Candidatus Ancillula sp.]|jgi:DHA1 family bicyclomycin/chloramphenicol resistance-like MFS transporter|nr:multidrug effflux MFS transporter [Candidatus Ancillula sp.]
MPNIVSQLLQVRPRRAKRNASWVVLLGSLCALPALAGDMYLPLLPSMVIDLHTTQSIAGLTISATLLGGAFGQILIGPLSDKYGRRKPVIMGILVHIIVSLLCCAVTSIEQLIALRIIQGAANSVANVIAMAVSRDEFSGSKASRILSQLTLITGVSPLFAPSIGSVLDDFGGWRTVFVLLALVGVALLVAVWRTLPETHPKNKRMNISIFNAIGLYKGVLSNYRFVALSLVAGLAQATVMCWIISSPFIAQSEWHFSPQLYALTFGINGVGLVVGAQVNASFVEKIGRKNALRAALMMQLVLATSMLLLTSYFDNAGPILLLPMVLIAFCHTFVTANATSIALEFNPELAGTASAFIGVMNSLLPALISPIVGFLGGTSGPVALTMCCTLVVSMTTLTLGTGVIIRKDKLPTIPNF